MGHLPDNFPDLVEHWTLLSGELNLLAGKHDGATKLGFSLLLKFYGRHGRFPRGRSELRRDAVEFVAAQLRVPAGDLGFYEWGGATIKRHRAEIRRHFGFREITLADQQDLTRWLASDYAQRVRRAELVREELLSECRTRHLEPPTPGRIDRIVASALAQAGEAVAALVFGRVDPAVRLRLQGMLQPSDCETEPDSESDEDPSLLRWIKESVGDVSLSTMLDEISRLETIRSFALPADLFRDVATGVVREWVTQTLVESPSHLRRHTEPVRVSMLAALLLKRQQQVTDQLVRLLLSTVHRIGLKAEKKVFRQMAAQFTKVSGKESLLLKVADAATRNPDDTVRQVVYPVVGEENLRNLAEEFKAGRSVVQIRIQASYRESYTGHYRRGLVKLLDVLEFRCENSHQPVLDALALVRRYVEDSKFTYYPAGEEIVWHRGLSGDWEQLVYRTAKGGTKRIVRAIYELRTLEALCDQLNCKGIWVVGAEEFRSPTYSRTSSPTAASTTPPWPSPWTRPSSSPASGVSWSRSWPRCTPRCRIWTSCGSSRGAGTGRSG